MRLPYQPRGWLRDFRRELGTACRTLVAGPPQILHATYSSEDRSLVDLENALTYNLGTGAISAAVRYGLVLERRFSRVGPATAEAHHYRYRLTDQTDGWMHWAAGAPLASIQLHAPASLFASPDAKRWWLATRRADTTAHARTAAVPDRFVMRVVVSPPERWRGSLAGLLTPMADGLISAVHAHEGPVKDTLLDRAGSIDPSLTPRELHDLLVDPDVAPLGRVRFLVVRGSGVMVLPADDRLVALDLRIVQDEPAGSITADIAQATTA